jgi:hypothetical protein
VYQNDEEDVEHEEPESENPPETDSEKADQKKVNSLNFQIRSLFGRKYKKLWKMKHQRH